MIRQIQEEDNHLAEIIKILPTISSTSFIAAHAAVEGSSLNIDEKFQIIAIVFLVLLITSAIISRTILYISDYVQILIISFAFFLFSTYWSSEIISDYFDGISGIARSWFGGPFPLVLLILFIAVAKALYPQRVKALVDAQEKSRKVG